MVYVMSDLHGTSPENVKYALEMLRFSENDYCYVLGDVIDRGSNSVELLLWLMSRPNIKFILGNHEGMLLSCDFLFETITDESIDNLSEDDIGSLSQWQDNGGDVTIEQLSKIDKKTLSDILEYIRSAPLYDTVRVNGRDFLLTHSGLGNFSPDKSLDEYSTYELLWMRPKITDRYYSDIMTVFGHSPTALYSSEYKGKVIYTDTWIDIDIGIRYSKKFAVLCLDDLKAYYFNA